MKSLIHFLLLIFLLQLPLAVSAVTEKEMEQARTIAAKAYLRYANDGSGYLDEINPNSMAELEKNLKTKEKENFKAFKAIPIPSDYASWDKTKLVEYWAGTAYKTKGLIEKGLQGKNRARKLINNMAVTPPQSVKAPEEKKGIQPQTISESSTIDPATLSSPVKETASSEDKDSSVVINEVELMVQQGASLNDMANLEDEQSIQKEETHTWVYIMILSVLVVVVVALVVFAFNVLKKNDGNAESYGRDSVDVKKLRRKYNEAMEEKLAEIGMLSKKLEAANTLNASLNSKIETLNAEIASLRTRLASAQSLRPQEPVGRTETPVRQSAPQQSTDIPKANSAIRSIYLGRANSKGIFIRADRNLNIGNSIYLLETSDGYSGTFRVADDPTVWKIALLTPRESLAEACLSSDLENTDGVTKIVTDSAGTAIFEGGCWKVTRKAKIHYE